MTAAALIDLLLRSVLLTGAIWLAAFAIRRAGLSAATRHLAWLLGFAGLALLPLLAMLVPPLALPVLPAVQEAPVIHGLAQAAAPAASAAPGWSLLDILPSAYAAIALALLARPIAAQVLLSRIWRQARPLGDPERTRLVDSLAQSLGICRAVRLRLCRGPCIPMTWGILRPHILLPDDARCWPTDQWRSVLLHELGHVARHDSATRTAAALLCALYWANPLSWLAAAHMRREQEHACDDLVLSRGAEAAGYARNLLAAARALAAPGMSASFAAAIVRRSELECRLVAIVGDVPRSRTGPLFGAVATVMAVSVTALVAATVPVAPITANPVPAAATFAAVAAPAPLPQPVPNAPANLAIQSGPAKAPAALLVAAAPVEAAAPGPYEQEVARYDREMVAYDAAVAEYRRREARYEAELVEYRGAVAQYRSRLADYRAAVDRYERDLADYRRRVDAGEHNLAAPTAPTAPTYPTAPTAPTQPTQPTQPMRPPSFSQS